MTHPRPEKEQSLLTRAWVVSVASVLLLSTGACGSGGVTEGSAFGPLGPTRYGVAPFPPDSRVGILALDLVNNSTQSLTLERVEVVGAGIGDVARVFKQEAAPLAAGTHATPGGVYDTDPPAVRLNDACHIQDVRPLAGYEVPPGGGLRIWTVLQFLGPGRFLVQEQPVWYEQNGTEYRQVMPISYKGAVIAGMPVPKPDPHQLACVPPARLLNQPGPASGEGAAARTG